MNRKNIEKTKKKIKQRQEKSAETFGVVLIIKQRAMKKLIF
jgi:hypothetical protein